MAPYNIRASIYHHIQCLMKQYSSFLWLSRNTPYTLYTVLCRLRLSKFYHFGILHSQLEFCMEQNCRTGQKALVP